MEETEQLMGTSQPPRPGQRLIAHSVLNACGQGIPIVAALLCVPTLLRQMGTERFGLLTLAWSVIGYSSLFDLGLGRALTQLVAERRHAAEDPTLVQTVRSALTLMLAIGLVGGVVGLAASQWLATSALEISDGLRAEAATSFRLLAVGVPLVVLTTGLRGILEAYERFDLVNAVRIPIGVSTFLGPLVAAFFSNSLVAAVSVLLAARGVGLLVHALMARRVLPGIGSPPFFASSSLRSVARFGAWITVSNVLSPLMSSADRFFIGVMLSTSVVAYYTAPFEMITRLTALVAVAVSSSLFPMFARWRRVGDAQALFSRGLRLTLATFGPIMAGIVIFAPGILGVWLGQEFADHSTAVLRILAVGVFVNGLAQVPFAHIQAVGRADLTAKIHLAEIPAYLALLIYLLRTRGIEGAAVAWTIRTTVDTALMFVVSRRLLAAPAAPGAATEPA
jgi:O-antigen/teichoic acid export membrane protein